MHNSALTRQRDGLVEEISESIALAECQVASEHLAGNIVKEEYWNGELVACRRMEAVLDLTETKRPAPTGEMMGEK